MISVWQYNFLFETATAQPPCLQSSVITYIGSTTFAAEADHIATLLVIFQLKLCMSNDHRWTLQSILNLLQGHQLLSKPCLMAQQCSARKGYSS